MLCYDCEKEKPAYFGYCYSCNSKLECCPFRKGFILTFPKYADHNRMQLLIKDNTLLNRSSELEHFFSIHLPQYKKLFETTLLLC